MGICAGYYAVLTHLPILSCAGPLWEEGQSVGAWPGCTMKTMTALPGEATAHARASGGGVFLQS